MKLVKCVLTSIMLGSVIVTSPASAADDDSYWDIESFVGASTDYRDRGLRLSDGDISAFGSVGAYHSKGFYIGVDGASIDDGLGNDARTEFYAGYSLDTGDYIYDFSLELEGIHGTSSQYYPEIKASISRDFGLAYIRGGLAVAPEGRWSAPDVDSYYSYVDLDVPFPMLPNFTILTHVGYDVRDGRSNIWDWSLGVSAFVMENIELNLSYQSSSLDQAIGKDGFVLGVKIYF